MNKVNNDDIIAVDSVLSSFSSVDDHEVLIEEVGAAIALNVVEVGVVKSNESILMVLLLACWLR